MLLKRYTSLIVLDLVVYILSHPDEKGNTNIRVRPQQQEPLYL